MMTSLGIRNNNPGNIVAGNSPWVGQIGTNKGFVVFDTPRHGLRALARNLLAYYEKHGLKTIRDIVTRWAPPSENNTTAYINAVCLDMGGKKADDVIDLHDHDTLDDLVRAIVLHENGFFPYSARDLVSAVNDALEVA